MPNWVTNKVRAPRQVLEALLNEQGDVDFKRIVAFEGEFPWDGVNLDAETLAESVTQKALSTHPMVRALEIRNRQDANIAALSDESFEQFIQMLHNYRKWGFLHPMDFARERWGTKWNACDCVVDLEEGVASFKTAWACPMPVLETLSRVFPDYSIWVQYADEDIGSNCGSILLQAGEYVMTDIAPAWRDQSDEEKAKWKTYAYSITGRTPPEEVPEGESG